MTLGQFLIKLGKRWKLIVMCVVLLGVGAYAGSKLLKPIYQSAVIVQVSIRSSSSPADYNSLLASDQLVQTEVDIAVSDPVLRQVVSHYPGLTVDQLSKEVTATPNVNTQLFTIDVQDQSPARAANLANDIAATLIKQQTESVQQGSNQDKLQLQQDLQQTQQQIQSTTNQISTLQATGGSQAELSSLRIQLDSLQQHSSQVQAALVQLELTNSQASNFLVVIQPAQPALKPIQPNVLLNTGAGLFVGLLLAIALVLLFDQLDTRVSDAEALSELLDCPVLATITQAESKEDVLNPVGKNRNVEAYHILRSNIGFLAVDKPLRTILVTSAVPREGKSAVAANLAVFMARAGKNTLLIDADFRYPRQFKQFDIPAQTMGLSNAIMEFTVAAGSQKSTENRTPISSLGPIPSGTFPASRASLDKYIYAVDIPNLCFMPAGLRPPNPPELLDSKAMQLLLTMLDNCGFETIILDSPALLGLSDASILASRTDSTLVVVDITRARKGNLTQMKSILEQAGANVIGTVINKQRRSRDHAIHSHTSSTQELYGFSSNSLKNGHNPPVTPAMQNHPESQPQRNGLDR